MSSRKPFDWMVFVLGVCGASLGCASADDNKDGDSGSLSDRRICDGSAGLRFAATIPPQREADYARVMYELGSMYIMVNGACEYIVWDTDPINNIPFGAWSAVRAGVLDEALEQELGAFFDYASWPANAGKILGPDSQIWDASNLVLFDGENRVTCLRPCDVSAPKLEWAINHFNEWTSRLYERGTDLNGPMRLRVFEFDRYVSPPDPKEWPLSTPPHELLAQSGDPQVLQGPAALITDKQDLDRLREVRRIYFEPYMGPPEYLEYEDPALIYSLAFRDVTPFENDDGQIPGLFGN